MIEKPNNINLIVFDQILDRREDFYAYSEFGKIVNRYNLSDRIYSDEFWIYLKKNFNIKTENIIMFCDIHTNSKTKVEKKYTYIIKIDKPNKLLLYFNDEEKIINSEIEDEQRNKISNLSIYFDSDINDYASKIIEDIMMFI